MVTNGSSGNGKISTINVEPDDPLDGAADIERALTETGYGKFNVFLLVAALPVAWAGIFDTTTTAFFLASAECELDLTFIRKGVLVSIPFIAMTLTSFLWDHVTPYVGKRNLFVLGLLADSILNIFSTSVDSYYVMLLIKFLSGILAGGPFSMVAAYLSEFHATKYKANFTRWGGFAMNVAIVFPAIIAFLITPLTFVVNVFDRRYSAWRVYLLLCSIVHVVGLVTASTLPQSPKFLLEIGKPNEALKLLGKMYCINLGKPADTFPIKRLLIWKDLPLSQPSLFKANADKLRLACYNTKLLFSSPYLHAVAFLNFLQFGSMLGFHTMRLWVPHMFIILNNFDNERWNKDRAPTMCEMLDRRNTIPARDYLDCPGFDSICIQWTIRATVYQNSAIIASSAVVFSFLAGIITTTKFRRKLIMAAAFFLSVVSSFGMNWAQSAPYMLTLASAIIVTMRITGNIVTAVNVDVIPIPLRSTSLNMLTAVGNVGAIVGNFAFSALLDVDCLVGFMGIGGLLFVCFCASFFHPQSVRGS